MLSSRLPRATLNRPLPLSCLMILLEALTLLIIGEPHPASLQQLIGPPPPPPLISPAGQVNNFKQQLLQVQPPPPIGASDQVCGLNMKELRHERIVGGRSATYAEMPWMVHMRESQMFRVLGYNKCGGVLLNHRWVLTAAHCKPAFFSSLEIILGKLKTFEDAPPPEGSAMAAIVKMTGKSGLFSSGSSSSLSSSSSSSGKSANDIDVDARKHPVMQVLADTVIVHPDYDSKTLENDLALIKMKATVPYREDIQPICLPGLNEDFTGLEGLAVGWGLTDFDRRQLPERLQVVRLPILSNRRCQSMYKKAGHDKVITETDLCAGYARGGMDACEGDSGGPLIVKRPGDNRYTVVGVVSNGVKCGEPLLPGVYTYIPKYMDWIVQQMKQHT